METENIEQATIIKEVSAPLFHSKGWMKFLGILSIIYGVLMAISIIGIIFAWLPIWLGILIYQSSTSAENAYVTGDKHSMIRSLNQLKTFFTISGVLALIGIILTIIFVTTGLLTYLFTLTHIY